MNRLQLFNQDYIFHKTPYPKHQYTYINNSKSITYKYNIFKKC